MVIQGEKTFVRRLYISDAGHILNWENNRENWLVSGTTRPYTETEIRNLIRSMGDFHEQKQLRNMICDKLGNRIGLIDLYDFNPEDHSAWVGVLIAHKQNRQQGYATDALKVWIRYASELLGVKILRAKIFANNEASIRLFSRQDFVSINTNSDMNCITYELKLD